MNIRSLTMKWLTFTLLVVAGLQQAKAQYVYKIKADTVRIYNTCDTAELVLQNRTQNVLGYLYNKGAGVTEFRALGAVDSMYRRNDTLFYHMANGSTIPVKMDLSGTYDLKATNYITVAAGDSANFAKLPLQKVVGVSAYDASDMPPLSNQAFYGTGTKTFYQGFGVTDGLSAVNFMVNWNGETKGPNGAFLRVKDDNRPAWGAWRELLFKDYADSNYIGRVASSSEPSSVPAFTGDLNTVINTNISLISQSATNTPAGRTGILFSGGDNSSVGGGRFQLYGGVSQSDDLWMRYGGGSTWNGWQQIASRTWANANLAPITMPLSTVLTNGNTANNNIVLGASGNTNQYVYQVIRNVGGNNYSSILGVGDAGQTVLSARNTANVATANYITLAPGGTAPVYSPNNGTNTYNIWHAGNGGAGSGLDADLLDGVHASGFISNQTTAAQTGGFWVNGFGVAATLNTGAATNAIQFSTNNGSFSTTGSTHRWSIYHSTTESGTNTGNDFNIGRYDNTGTFISSALTIQRSTGNVGIGTQSPSQPLEVNGNIKTSGTLFFNRPMSDGNLIADFQQGYKLYSDTTGAIVNPSNTTRLWFEGPNKGSIVLGPRTFANIFNVIRMRADTIRLEGNSGKWSNVTSLGTDVDGNLKNTSGNFIQNQNTAVQATSNFVISGRGTAQSIGTYQASAGTPHWVLFNGSNANNAVRWSVSMLNAESSNNNGADFTINRYDSNGIVIDNVLFAKRSTGNIGIGNSLPSQKLDVTGSIAASTSVITPLIKSPTASTDLTLQPGSQIVNVTGTMNVSAALNVSGSFKTAGSVTLPQRTVSLSTSLLATDYTVFTSTSGITLTLPTASSATGRIYEIVNASTGSITISAVLVFATSTTAIPTNTSWRIQSDGTNWRLLSRSN